MSLVLPASPGSPARPRVGPRSAQAKRYAQSPEGRAKIDQVRRQLAARAATRAPR